jgi:hypothetical protein
LPSPRFIRPSVEPAQTDRLVGLLAITVAAIGDTRQRGIDLGDQLALAVARPQLDRALGLQRGTVGDVGFEQALFLEMLQGLARFRQEFGPPAQQLLAEILELAGVHELFVFRGMVGRRLLGPHQSLRRPRPDGGNCARSI